jgi:tRNA A37 N6-isopentenylltransferase MiaA
LQSNALPLSYTPFQSLLKIIQTSANKIHQTDQTQVVIDLEICFLWKHNERMHIYVNTSQIHFPDLPFPKRKTAMGTVEAR